MADPPPNGTTVYPPGVYTRVEWNLGDLAAGQIVTIRYAAGIPLRANTTTWPGGAPSPASLAQAANLDNNTGPSTREGIPESSATNIAQATGTYSGPDAYDLQAGYWTSVTAGILYINWRPSTAADPNYSNSSFTDDPVLAQYILDGNSAATVEQQNADYQKAQDYIAQHALSIGVYDRLSTLAVSPKLHDVWQEHAQGGPTFYDAYLTK